MSRRWVLALAAVLAALVAVLVLSDPTEDRYHRPDLDPRGTGPGGTAALVALLREEGATVVVGGRPRDRDDVVLQLRDTFSGAAHDGLDRWVATGGTLVVADPGAQLAPPAQATGLDDAAREPGRCPLRALAPVEEVSPGLPWAFRPGDDDSACFADPTGGPGAGLVVSRRGAGLVVAVAGTVGFTNSSLAADDNAVLARVLLVPHRGARVRVLDPTVYLSDADVGDGTVLGALPTRGRQALAQLVVAFLAWGLVTGRRLGRPVEEELPVPVPASDLVLASGHLLDRNADAPDAAARLRRRARRDLGVATGLGPDPDPHELAAVLRTRAGVEPALVDAALLAPVVDDAGLVTVSSHLDRLRRELFR